MNETFYILLWVCSVLLVVSGTDDIMVDLMYWFYRWKYRRNLPNIDEVTRVAEKTLLLLSAAGKSIK